MYYLLFSYSHTILGPVHFLTYDLDFQPTHTCLSTFSCNTVDYPLNDNIMVYHIYTDSLLDVLKKIAVLWIQRKENNPAYIEVDLVTFFSLNTFFIEESSPLNLHLHNGTTYDALSRKSLMEG